MWLTTYILIDLSSSTIFKPVDLAMFPKKSDGIPESLLSPIQCMPAEIMAEIFCWSLPNNPNLKVSYPPLLLGRVCSNWRKIALSTPRLWSSLGFESGFIPSSVTGIETWLTRAGSCPLTLSFAGGKYPSSLFWCLMKFSERWENVHFCFPVRSLLCELSAAKGKFSSLRNLELRLFGRWTRVVDAFEVAPQLRSVSLPHRMYMKPSLFRLPWHQLTKLVVAGITVVEMLGMLRCSPNLMEFHITEQDCQDYPDAYLDIPIVTLNQLQTLNIRYPTQPHNIFERLTLPALRDLTMTRTLHWPRSEFMTFLSRSSCSLTRLQVHNSVSSAAQLIEILDNMPLLVEMDIIDDSFERDDDLMMRLIYDPDPDDQKPC